MKKKIIIVGKAGSGKDYLRNGLSKAGYICNVAYTTRPIRQGELNDWTYRYVTTDQFKQLAIQNLFYQKTTFNQWHYGTLYCCWNNCQVFIQTPSEIEQLSTTERTDCLIVYLDIDTKTRRSRLMKRNDADSVERRLMHDKIDFNHLTNVQLIISNPAFCLISIVKQLLTLVPIAKTNNTTNIDVSCEQS